MTGLPTLRTVLYIAALVLLLLAAAGVPAGRVGLGWLGLACWLTAAAILPA